MGEYSSGSATTFDQLIAAIKSVCVADGWSVDLDTAARIHIHKGDYHFDLGQSGGTLTITGCTGYASGQSAANQPNAKTANANTVFYSGFTTHYTMVSTGPNFYCTSYTPGTAVRSFWGFGVVVDKVGVWDGGQFVHGNNVAFSADNVPWYGLFQGPTIHMRINNEWAPNTTYGAFIGNYHTCGLRGKMPFAHNAGILKLPLDIYHKNIGNSALLHPVGQAPNLYMVRGGDVYAIGDTITFDGDDFVFLGELGQSSTVASLMVKLD